jgi:transposase
MYSLDFRKHVLKVGAKEGLSIRGLAQRFGIGFRTIVNWKKRLDPILKRNRTPTKINIEALKQDVETYPDAYGYERAKRLNVSKSCIHYTLKKIGVTYKKKPCGIQKRFPQNDKDSKKKLNLIKRKKTI